MLLGLMSLRLNLLINERCRKLKIGNKNCSLQPLIGCPFGSVFRVETGSQGPYLSLSNSNTEGLAGKVFLFRLYMILIDQF